MKRNAEIVQLFSGGKFDEVEDYIAENVEWEIYEEKMTITGKAEVLKFCKSVTEYFKTITTKFEMFGLVDGGDKVSIYGRAEFVRAEKTVNVVHSCDVYEFNADGKILKIYSYCNSQPAEV